MKPILSFTLLLFVFTAHAQEFKYKKKLDKWIFKSENGKWDNSIAYDSARSYRYGMCAVALDKKWGYIDENGEIIIKPLYNDIYYGNNKFWIKLDGKVGILDTTGNTILKPVYDKIDYYHDGKALVKLNEEWVIIENGEIKRRSEEELIFQDPDKKAFVKTPSNDRNEGDMLMYKTISKNLRYPEDAASKGIDGKVYLRLTIDKEGKQIDTIILRSKYKSLDDEALRVVSQLGFKWEPAIMDGKKVKSYYILPIKFQLN